MFDSAHYAALGLKTVYHKVHNDERLTPEEGDLLFACPDILALGALAHHRRMRMHGLNTYYVRNRHINYSNICVTRCRFCAFRREQGQRGAFTLTKEEIIARAMDDDGHPFDEIHVVGGCHPDLTLDWFEDVFRGISLVRPQAVLKAFTVVEIAHFAAMHNCSIREVLARLRDAGLRMLTGGGAEIFEPSVRGRICPEKISGEEYLRIAGLAHELGLRTNCSMLFGHVESPADRVRHLCALREQQDKTGGFTCFIPLPFQTKNNSLAETLEKEGRSPDVDSGLDRLRTIAVSRLMLDNIPHIKAYWVMLGVKLAQTALNFGADDLDGTIEEEHIGHMAGADSAQALTRQQLETMIRGCGFTPVNRNALFESKPQERPTGDTHSEYYSHTYTAPAPASEADDDSQETHPPQNSSPIFVAESRKALSRSALLPLPSATAILVRRLYDAYTYCIEAARNGGPDSKNLFPLSNASIALRQVAKEIRLDKEEALRLYHEADLFTLGTLAHKARLALHPDPVATYVADRNINYSNICSCGCRFCAFFRPPKHAQRFIIGKDELREKILETVRLGGTQILMQGGHHPDLPLEFYEYMLSWIHADFPSLHIHSFSPPEIAYFAKKEHLDIDTVLDRLIASGLTSLPGGGAEILVDRVRQAVSPRKCSAGEWLEVMEKAHLRGLKTTATMMFGHEETDAERLAHLFVVRDLQDRTHGFTAFIPWTFQPDNTAIARPQETSQAYLRMLAVSRLTLDNVPNIQASWVTMGPQVAQLALFFGANDFGSLMIEENVVAAAGTSFLLNRRQIHDIITQAGFTPRQRYMDYTLLEREITV